ncbi:MAG: hypothetical protein Q8K92_14845 [Leadbetterella sp.]|nr:hypothetical protein [Leadbetterella sp.]
MKFSDLYILTFLGLFSCNNLQNNQSDYKYTDEVLIYFNEIFHINLEQEKNKIYYLFEVEGCENCIDINSKMLLNLNQNENLVIVFIGESKNQDFINRINTLKKKFLFLEDKFREINNYKTNLAKPILIHLGNNGIKKIQMITDDRLQETSRYINENL